MDKMSKLQKELLEVKKYQAEACRDKADNGNLAEIASFLKGLDGKIERLAEEDVQLKEKLGQLKSKKVELRKKLISKDEQCKALQVDLEYVNKENTNLGNLVAGYEDKIKRSKSYHLANADIEVIKRTVDKVNIFRRFAGIKFGSPDGDMVEGCVYNEKNSHLKHFQLRNDSKCDPELWRMVKEASHTDWTTLENQIKEELRKKR